MDLAEMLMEDFVSKSSELVQGLEALKADYRDKLPHKLVKIKDTWEEISSEGWREELARSLRDDCHHLAGTGTTFGHSNLTRYARIVEVELTRIFDDEREPSQNNLSDLDVAIVNLLVKGPVEDEVPKSEAREDAEQRVDEEITSSQQQNGTTNEPIPRTVHPLSTLPIFVVEDDIALADHIVMELALQGYDGRAVYELADLEQKIQESGVNPGAIVMDVIFPDAVTGGIDIINTFRQNEILKAPVIFISANDSFSTRLKIVRAGGDAFFAKPFETAELIQKLESLIGETNPDPLRVLVVDDDEQYTILICGILQDAGLHVKGINDPVTVIGEVLEFNPDLVILDMYMPEANGMEVAQILRQHESCNSLPLLFLSAETDPEIRAAALNIGVDDFLVKPVDHKYLVSAVANRAQRARALDARIYRDSLTQLLVHDEIKRQLAIQLAAAQRRARDLSYVILDLDNFKRINDTHGHLTGDQVIKSLVSLLRRRFRRSDILGRYGGEEFVIIMPETNLADAAAVLDKVREEFSHIGHRSELDGKQFFATFSAGISSFPVYEEPDELQSSADRAMYTAKEAGRNKVKLA
jgi:diguanylate cyclase (GGDEF)-like protein